jgi:pilus assembly protein CpaE
MLRAVTFSPDGESREPLVLALEDNPSLLLLKTFDRFLPGGALLDYVRAHAPQIMFFDIAQGREPLLEAASALKGLGNVHLVAVDRDLDAEVLLELMNSGVREFLRYPWEPEKLASTLARVESAVSDAPRNSESTDMLYSFLPAKPGAGASTLAIHTAIELSHRQNNPVLLADLDLNCGISRFLLKLPNAYGVRDAVAKAHEMDDGLWAELHSTYDGLAVLPAGLIDGEMQLEATRIRALFEFARRRYRVVIADLSGMMESFALDVLQQSRRVLLVVDPDLASVHMAREKLRYLERHELQDRMALVINRWRKDAPLSIADIESVLGLPAEATISDAPEAIYKSVMRGGAIDPASLYSREVSDLAQWLYTEPAQDKGPKPKRKVEYFSIVPGRYSLTRG